MTLVFTLEFLEMKERLIYTFPEIATHLNTYFVWWSVDSYRPLNLYHMTLIKGLFYSAMFHPGLHRMKTRPYLCVIWHYWKSHSTQPGIIRELYIDEDPPWKGNSTQPRATPWGYRRSCHSPWKGSSISPKIPIIIFNSIFFHEPVYFFFVINLPVIFFLILNVLYGTIL